MAITKATASSVAPAAAGDLVYGSGTNDAAVLGIGTAGQVLQVNSGATAPEWITSSSGGMTQLATGSLSGATTTISSIPGTYKDLILRIYNARSSTTSSYSLRFNNDSNTRYSSRAVTTESNDAPFNNDFAAISNNQNSSTSQALIDLRIPNYANTTTWKMGFTTAMTNANVSTELNRMFYIFAYNQTSAITDITILSNSGTFSNGTYILYGVN